MEAYIYQAALLCADCAVITMNEFELFNMLGGSSSPFRQPKPWTDSDRPPGPVPERWRRGRQSAALRCLWRLP